MQNKYSKFVNTEELRKTRENKGFSIRDMSKFMGFKSEQIDKAMEKLIRENEELKSYIRTIQNISNQIKV